MIDRGLAFTTVLVKISVAVLVVGALTVAGIAAFSPNEPEVTPAAKPADIVNADPRLKQIFAQSNEILGGGEQAFDKRMKELRGLPIVVNKWASWCGPCKYETPILREAARELGDRVAFLGVVLNDSAPSAQAFLAEQPVPYPSYFDPKVEISRELPPATKAPITNIYDASGKLVNSHAGPIPTVADLKQALARYAGVKS